MRIQTLASLALLAAFAAPAAAGVAPPGSLTGTSWGKPGVSLEQYWRDSAECAAAASSLDVSQTPAARTLFAASRDLDQVANSMWMDLPTFVTLPLSLAGNGSIRYQQTFNKYRPQEQIASVRQLMMTSLGRCLTERGYREFRLTQAQARQLRRYRRGTAARRLYLHSLGSDSAVIASQQI